MAAKIQQQSFSWHYSSFVGRINSRHIKSKLTCIYMKEQDPFQEILDYLAMIKQSFPVEIYEYQNDSEINPNFMQDSLQRFINTTGVSVIITGTRSTDPWAQGLSMSQPSDSHKGWPLFQRVMPIYFWDYETVWKFILEAGLPYCSLYNSGYTYVGDRSSSIPNPFIKDRHAMDGNDNIELFSRKSLFESLPRSNGKILISARNLILIIVSEINQQFNPKNFSAEIFRAKLAMVCGEYNFELQVNDGGYEVVQLQTSQFNSKKIFNQIVVEKKGISGNFSQLFVGLVVNIITDDIFVHI